MVDAWQWLMGAGAVAGILGYLDVKLRVSPVLPWLRRKLRGFLGVDELDDRILWLEEIAHDPVNELTHKTQRPDWTRDEPNEWSREDELGEG